MKIDFFKYQGTGNDFVILDNRNQQFDSITSQQVKFLCDRKFGVGADGLLMLQLKAGFDFEMTYFNSDGNKSTMCGNGGRCLVRFAHRLGIHKYTYKFIAADGEHEAEIDNQGEIRLKMQDVKNVQEHGNYSVLNTGSPHYVKFVSDLAELNVNQTGRDIRNSKLYKENGINVNFVENIGENLIFVRTYERGVETETLSCGTGVTAAAIIAAHNHKGFNRVEVKTSGGKLAVEYNKIDEHNFENVWLCGKAEFIFKGEIDVSD
ncbi:MAG: diaminopimelate epimerase [Ferruginibacter sp.]